MSRPGSYSVTTHPVHRRSSRPTWDEWKAEVRTDVWDCYEVGRYPTLSAAQAAAGSDWGSLCKEDQYNTVYQIEWDPEGGDPDGNDSEVMETRDFWMEMISARKPEEDDDYEAYEGR